MKLRWVADAPPWAARAEAVIARHMGFFRDAGIHDADVSAVSGETKALDMLLEGRADVVSGLARKAFIAHAHGAPVRILGVSKNRLRAGLAVDPKIGDPRNLRGKTVAVGIFGAVVERLSRLSLETLGVDPNEVKYVEVGTGSLRIEAVRRGEIQAAIMMNSHLEAARLAGLDVYETLSNRYPKYAFHTLCTTRDVLERQPQLIVGMLQACLRGHRLLRDDSRINEVAPLFVAQVPGGGRTEWEAERADVLLSCTEDLAIEDEAMTNAVRFEQEFGLLPEEYDWRPSVDPRPLAEALRHLDQVAH
jgi:ABC-type nitrate/sulfonate/bicarbonate transport system substrate-binding protein